MVHTSPELQNRASVAAARVGLSLNKYIEKATEDETHQVLAQGRQAPPDSCFNFSAETGAVHSVCSSALEVILVSSQHLVYQGLILPAMPLEPLNDIGIQPYCHRLLFSYQFFRWRQGILDTYRTSHGLLDILGSVPVVSFVSRIILSGHSSS
ncbi:MAG: toxin-antitoxin system HicB family antitoxin [Spirochaetaceae bacterium]|nr:MAG: toxin-antitoxin system HicB family antitoxin [Spirochaetaceae bacterium]